MSCAVGATIAPGRLRDAYADWIGQEPFDIFLTLTAAGRTSPEGMDKRNRWVISKWGKLLYGNNAHRRGLIINGVYGIERHKSGNPHSHGCFRFPRPVDVDRALLDDLKAIADDGGFSRVEVPADQARITSYVCKYVVKEGELFFTPTWTPVRSRPSLL